ncbi:acyl-CoA carboxylase subunit epsilon [Streptomyces sviceus]|uniref:acyl-CoA carboxylase subunit epsilon n=1 Tax=Streptomyces sviceus TaxID=285530 RepID=UPI0036E82B7B
MGSGGAPVLLRVVRGNPAPEELAAVAALLTTIVRGEGGGREQDRGPVPAPWGRPGRAYRAPGTWTSRPGRPGPDS